MLPLRMGHSIEGGFCAFPHRCPGEGCAIARWLADREAEAAYRDLPPTPTPEPRA